MSIFSKNKNRWMVAFLIFTVFVLFITACSETTNKPDDGDKNNGKETQPTIGFLLVDGIAPQGGNTLVVSSKFKVILSPSARNGKSITRVELNVNGINLPSKTSPPWEFEVDFGALSTSGPATLSAVAVDSGGQRSKIATQQVIVDATAPTVNIVEPSEGTVITGNINMVITAKDPQDVIKSVSVLLDGKVVAGGAVRNPSQEVTLEVEIPVDETLADGTHTLVAQARDEVGNVGTSQPVNIKTNNQGAPTEPPGLSIDIDQITPESKPAAGCIEAFCFSSTLNIPVNIDDESGKAAVSLLVKSSLGTQALGPIAEFPYSFSLATEVYPNNTKLTLIALGKVENGAESRSEPVEITIYNADNVGNSPIRVIESLIEPRPQPIPNCNASSCYSGNISVLVAVQNAAVGSLVSLSVDSVIGRDTIGPTKEFPYKFEINTARYPDNTKLTLIANYQASEEDNPSSSEPVEITIYNGGFPVSIVEFAIQPPPIAITGCSDAECYRGTIKVPVAVKRPNVTSKPIVSLIVDGPTGTDVIGPLTEFPYNFQLDTTKFPDDSQLKLVAERRESEESQPSLSEPVIIRVFNSDISPPIVKLLRPEDGTDQIKSVSIAAQAIDEESQITELRIYFDGGLVNSEKFDPPVTTADLEATVELTALNDLGNIITLIPDGPHSVFAQAYNASELLGKSPEIIVKTKATTGTAPPPKEVLVGEISKIDDTSIKVPIKVVAQPEDDIAKVLLTMRSENLGTLQSLERDGGTTPYIFTVDTQPFVDGDVLYFIARAITVAGGTANSLEASYKISKSGNIAIAPKFKIETPNNLDEITIPEMDVEIEAIPVADGAEYQFTSDITVELINFRGDTIVSQVIEVGPKNTPITEPKDFKTSFDITKFPNDVYTLRATVNVAESSSPLEDKLQFRNRSKSDLPPASNIRMPIRLDSYNYPDCAIEGTQCQGLPVFNRDSGIIVEVSDDAAESVDFIDLRIVCDPRIAESEQKCDDDPFVAFLTNYDISGDQNKLKYFYLDAPEIDGTQYVPDGTYVLVMVTSDKDKRNIQELAIKVDRSQNTIPNLAVGDVIESGPGKKFNPESAEWFLNDAQGKRAIGQNSLRVFGVLNEVTNQITSVYKRVTIYNALDANTRVPSINVTFSDEGVYEQIFVVQDLKTGVVRRYRTPQVVVVKPE